MQFGLERFAEIGPRGAGRRRGGAGTAGTDLRSWRLQEVAVSLLLLLLGVAEVGLGGRGHGGRDGAGRPVRGGVRRDGARVELIVVGIVHHLILLEAVHRPLIVGALI